MQLAPTQSESVACPAVHRNVRQQRPTNAIDRAGFGSQTEFGDPGTMPVVVISDDLSAHQRRWPESMPTWTGTLRVKPVWAYRSPDRSDHPGPQTPVTTIPLP